MTLGDVIKKYRKTHDLSMDAFSGKSGISKAYISLLEKNKHPQTGKAIAPSIQCIKQAADGMDMDFNVLFSMIDGDVTLSSTKETDVSPIKNARNPRQSQAQTLAAHFEGMELTQNQLAEIVRYAKYVIEQDKISEKEENE